MRLTDHPFLWGVFWIGIGLVIGALIVKFIFMPDPIVLAWIAVGCVWFVVIVAGLCVGWNVWKR